jgi:murein L,D-transpeptidase YcbB/YkuD
MILIRNIFIALLFTVYSAVKPAIGDSRNAEILQKLISALPQEKKATTEMYRLSNARFIWLKNKPTEVALSLLAQAPTQGLNSQDYHSDWLATQWQQLKKTRLPSFYQQALFDSTLTRGILHYYSDLRYGRIKPRRVLFYFNPAKDPLKLAQQTWEAIQNNTMNQLSLQLEPTLFLYQNLKKALHHYQQVAKDYSHLAFKFSAKLKIGTEHQQVIKLRRLLINLGDFTALQKIDQAVLTSPIYDRAMAQAIKQFQQRHSLRVTGTVDKRTINALNIPLSARIQQIALGLERFRWFPRYTEDQLVFVNIPSFRLWAFNSLTEKPLTMRVVVGKTSKHKTPVFSSKMKYLVFRPYWRIPRSIINNEILPRVRRDPSYLARHNMERVGKSIRQRPGSRNALGLVKFIFPNDYAIYLHDTLSKSLFKRTRRDFSHGCIRVSQPADLASYLLKWAAAKVKKAMYKGSSRRANLAQEIPVVLFYSTVIAVEDATVTFLNDVYGYDAKLKRVLNRRRTAI